MSPQCWPFQYQHGYHGYHALNQGQIIGPFAIQYEQVGHGDQEMALLRGCDDLAVITAKTGNPVGYEDLMDPGLRRDDGSSTLAGKKHPCNIVSEGEPSRAHTLRRAYEEIDPYRVNIYAYASSLCRKLHGQA